MSFLYPEGRSTSSIEDVARQISLDVDRCASSLQSRPKLKSMLNDVILSVFRSYYPNLHYYQGFHDICTILLLVLLKDDRDLLRYPTVMRSTFSKAAHSIAAFWLRDFMEPDMSATVRQMEYVMEILKKSDPDLYSHLVGTTSSSSSFSIHFFSLTWLLTWFSHDYDPDEHSKVDSSLAVFARLFDFYLTSPPIMSLYFISSLVIDSREAIISSSPFSSHSEDYDHQNERQTLLYSTLTRLKIRDETHVYKLIQDAFHLYTTKSPIRISEIKRKFGSWSCLSTWININKTPIDLGKMAAERKKETPVVSSSVTDFRIRVLLSRGAIAAAVLALCAAFAYSYFNGNRL